jgi:hypothetical protein
MDIRDGSGKFGGGRQKDRNDPDAAKTGRFSGI